MTAQQLTLQEVKKLDTIDRLMQSRVRMVVMCSEGRPPRMSVPARPDDDDIFICEALMDAVALLKSL